MVAVAVGTNDENSGDVGVSLVRARRVGFGGRQREAGRKVGVGVVGAPAVSQSQGEIRQILQTLLNASVVLSRLSGAFQSLMVRIDDEPC